MNLLFLIASLFSSFLIVNSTVTCNYGDTEYDGYCYTFVDQHLHFPDAQAYCASLGGVLVRFRGNADGRWLTSTAATKFHATYGNFWIGLHYVKNANNENKTLIWDDGHDVNYTNWFSGSPFSGYDYVGARLADTKWVSLLAETPLPFICYYQKGQNRNQPTTPVPSELPTGICDGAELLLGHRCFFFNPTLLNYDLAKQECEKARKTLAIFDDFSQINFVTSTAISKFSMTYGSFWISLRKNSNDENDKKFYWADGSVNTLSNWTPGYPFQNQFVVSLQVSNSKWKTSDNSTYMPSVCSGYVQ
ncbi:hypothetical protein GCK72_014461 [Caenorhabditis remanei]|uniref:C-type lectin domain-containing protein n=1 Tax=Caenorhabditis remanei TaxID=31234 RepID=A0A6A5GU51_CAERE|nr:hypothetical protein GCK72_014461 [Caenorhabditis remanei]KAF1758003.1 hypothetical protein GCK72_014461 [Caenorhabditis remanei]